MAAATRTADSQIAKMVSFIKQEAQEKADEIDVQADNDFETQKQNIYAERRAEIEREFEESRKKRITEQKIARSKEINESRLEVMKQRHGLMNQTKARTLERLIRVADSPKYSQLVMYLIAQGLMMVMEGHVFVRARKVDEKVVRAQIQSALELFQEVMRKETGVIPNCKVEFDDKEYLPPPPSPGYEGLTSYGGVILHANNEQIICRNTLEARLDLVFNEQSPNIRGLLFGFREKAAEIEIPSEKTALIRDD